MNAPRDVSRRTFLGTAAAAAVASGLHAGQTTRRPNLLFVFADQMQSQILGCYGNTQVPTPNFDRLAAEGLRAANCISTWPLCSPYRGMLLTGLLPMHNGVVTNDTALRDGLPTIATVCRDHGYATGYIGKWHLEWNRDPFVPRERRQGFDSWAVRNCAHDYFDSFYCADTPEQIPLPGWEPAAQAALAADFIRGHRDRPFCLFLSWGPPHDPYVAPDSDLERFPPDQLRLPPNMADRDTVDRLLATDPSSLSEQNVARRQHWREVLGDDSRFRHDCLRGYCAATAALDRSFGTLLATLDETGLAADTIVVFTSDHGDMMGSHRMISKQLPFEESIAVPFLLRYPPRIAGGATADVLLSPVDLMPTLLGLAGLPCPAVDGLDLGPALRGEAPDPRSALGIMKLLPGGNPWLANGVTSWRGVRTKRHTYVRLLDRGPWLLYDNLEDPGQQRNLLGRAEQADLQHELDRLTTELMAAGDDPGSDAEILAFRQARRNSVPQPNAVPTRFALHQGDRLSRNQAPRIAGRPFTITALIEATGDGVVVAQGGIGSGYSLFVRDGRPVFVTRHKGPLAEAAGPDRLPAGKVTLTAELTRDGQLRLAVDGRRVATAQGPGLIPVLPGDGLEVGADEEHPVTDYTPPNPFHGAIHEVVIELGPP